jgi:sodium transport system permease protein
MGSVSMEEKPLAQTPWGGLTALLVVVLTYVVTLVIGTLVISIYPHSQHWTNAQANAWLQKSVLAQFGYVLLVETLTLAAIFLFIRWRKGSLRVVGLTKPRAQDIGPALLGFVAYFAIYYAAYLFVQAFIPQINLQQQQDVGFQTVGRGLPLALTFLSLVVLPPIAEEIVFRGFLYSGLRRALPMVYAGIVTSLVFASAHLLESASGGLLWIAGIDTFILSMVLVYLREKTGRLYAGMLVHALKNLVAFLVLYHVVLGL